MNTSKLSLTLLAALLFNLVFYHESLGLNLVIFDAAIITMIIKLYPKSLSQTPARWVLTGHVFAVAMVIIHNSMLSKVTAGFSLFLFAAFAEHVHRSVVFAAGSMFIQAGFMPREFTELISRAKNKQPGKKRLSKRYKIIIIPMLLAFVFFVIYLNANAAFANLTEKLLNAASVYFGRIFSLISWDRFGILVLGIYISGALLLKTRRKKLEQREAELTNTLIRTKNKSGNRIFRFFLHLLPGGIPKGPLALKSKYKMGLISFTLLNLLLLAINLSDFVYIWTADAYGVNASYMELVHEGTGVLIFSILLAIAVVLFFFDGNINFYKNNKVLRTVAMIWLVQNALLTASVFMRDYYYISHYGLAYKRIALVFFVVVVIAGLVSVIIKIQFRKSNYFLFRVNSNVIAIVFVISCAVNWDGMIAEYNLARMDVIKPDTEFLVNLSNKVLPVLHKYQDKLSVVTANKQYAVATTESWARDRYSFAEYIQWRENRFKTEYTKHSWLSWNLADAALFKEVESKQTVKR